MVVLDFSIVNVALPSIERELHMPPDAVQWIVTGYAISFGGLLILGGRAADLLGRRRMFVVGLVAFALASLAGGLAQDPALLIAARVIQGAGAAIVAPAALSLITTSFPEGPQRTRAIGLYGAISSVGFVSGQVLGGVLVQLTSWRAVFLVNVPVGVAAVLLARRRLAENRAPGRRRVPDLPGTLLFALAIGALVLGIVKGQQWGWGSARILGCLTAALASGAVVVWRCTWHRSPILDLSLVKIRTVSVANAMMVVGAAGFYGYTLSNVLFLTGVWRYSVLQAGLAQIAATARPVRADGETVRLVA